MDENKSSKKGLGLISLILGIGAALLLLLFVINFLNYGLLALLTMTHYFYLSITLSAIAWIAGAIADALDHADAGLAEVGAGIAKTCLGICVAFFIYVKFIA